MSRRLRYVPPGSVVEITQRTVQGRLLLRPSAELRRVVVGVLGRASERFDMPIHAFLFLSNHFHLLVSPADARHLARFMAYLSGNLAREVCRLMGWSDKVWARRYAHVPVLGEAAQVQRLRYVLAQGVKEGLVARAVDWPGPSCVEGLLDGSMRLTGIWYDRTTAYRAAQAGVSLEAEDWIHEQELILTPLPALAHLALEEYARTVAAMVGEIEADAANANARPVFGPEEIGRQNPATEVRRRSRSPIPLVHAATLELWIGFKEAYRPFVCAYRAASAGLRAGIRDVCFPPGSFAPPLGFVPH
jgi:putative transposase